MRDGDRAAARGSRAREVPKASAPPPEDERADALLAVGDIAGVAFLLLEEAARSSREDLDAVLRNIRTVTAQRDAARRALAALDEAGVGAVRHLRAVDDLTERASRVVAATLLDGDELVGEDALEQLDAWAGLSRARSTRLQQDRDAAWGLGEVLDALTELRHSEAARLQEVLLRRSTVLATLTRVIEQQAATAGAITGDPTSR